MIQHKQILMLIFVTIFGAVVVPLMTDALAVESGSMPGSIEEQLELAREKTELATENRAESGQMSQSHILEVATDDLIAPIGGAGHWYIFPVPQEAVNPRLIGHYEVISGLDIEVTVLD